MKEVWFMQVVVLLFHLNTKFFFFCKFRLWILTCFFSHQNSQKHNDFIILSYSFILKLILLLLLLVPKMREKFYLLIVPLSSHQEFSFTSSQKKRDEMRRIENTFHNETSFNLISRSFYMTLFMLLSLWLLRKASNFHSHELKWLFYKSYCGETWDKSR